MRGVRLILADNAEALAAAVGALDLHRAAKLDRIGIAAWFAYRLPGTVTFVVPAAVAALWLHVVRGRTILGALFFLVWMVAVPAVFWPSLLTDMGNDLSGLLP